MSTITQRIRIKLIPIATLAISICCVTGTLSSCALLRDYLIMKAETPIDTPAPGQPVLTPAQAKNEIYRTAHEIITAIYPVADINSVGFYYESGYDDGAPPFRAVIGIPVTTHPSYANKNLTDTYRNILLKLPGYNTNGNDHSHSPIIYKNDTFIYLPTTNMQAFEINGPLYVYEDLRKKPMPLELIDGQWEPIGPLAVEDVTKDFLPPPTTSTPSPSSHKRP